MTGILAIVEVLNAYSLILHGTTRTIDKIKVLYTK